MLPFTLEQFLNVFATYNKAIWPAQIAAYVLGTIALAALLWPVRASDRVVSAVLGLMWLCTGVLYHGVFFSSINKAAFALGALFVERRGTALRRHRPRCSSLRDQLRPPSRTVAGFILYVSRLSADRNCDGAFLAGLTDVRRSAVPCHDFTFGSTDDDPPLLLLASSDPFIWSLIGGSAAILLDVRQDWLLLVSGLIAVPIVRDRQAQAAAPTRPA